MVLVGMGHVRARLVGVLTYSNTRADPSRYGISSITRSDIPPMIKWLTWAGCACLLVVVLTHAAEHWSILPVMGWGRPDSPGHYLDLLSAVAGVSFLIGTFVMSSPSAPESAALNRVIKFVALLNLGYFGIEFTVARTIGSVSLFADSIDFLEDAAVNGLILVALGWSAHRRSIVGMILAAILLAPAVATAWTAWEKFNAPIPPSALPLSVTGLGALAVNLFCAFLLARYREHRGSLTRAAFLSARNDALANIAIIVAGGVTALTLSPWPDLIVGLGIFVLNLDAAREVYGAARDERREALAEP